MKIDKISCVPILLNDPYFSIWSPSQNLYDSDTTHWTGACLPIRGKLLLGNEAFCFMGDSDGLPVIKQVGLDITATKTTYEFENDKAHLTISFLSPMLLDDFLLVSRPVSYITASVKSDVVSEATVEFSFEKELVTMDEGEVIGSSFTEKDFHYCFMGRAYQHPLGHSADHSTYEWGYLYLGSNSDNLSFAFNRNRDNLSASMKLVANNTEESFVVAYDDTLSINYFGDFLKAYWTKTYSSIIEAMKAAIADQKEVSKKADTLDAKIEATSKKVLNSDYAFLCILSYRHSIAAHKLAEDSDGNILFVSKENDSNGCMATVDVSYPSIPLYLLFNTEYVKGMLRPIFKFAACDIWEFDYAPHDVGRYPYATGQVYALNGNYYRKAFIWDSKAIYPSLYLFPAGADLYDERYQMPVEECGNMLIMTAIISMLDKNADFAAPFMDTLSKWVQYLITYGADPGEQLCTDDFAGHLARNINLSAKAIMGIEAFAQIHRIAGTVSEYEKYHKLAKDMAKTWEEKAVSDDHTMLSFEQPDSWSLKYNLVWDLVFGSELFSETVYEREAKTYHSHLNEYGVPLDSRRDYTKSDWELWCVAMLPDANVKEEIVRAVSKFLQESSTHVPFSDWYETKENRHVAFKGRSVQGGIFMPTLLDFVQTERR